MPYPVPTEPVPVYDESDRLYLSPNRSAILTYIINVADVPHDADGDVTVTFSHVTDAGSVEVFSRDADHVATGTYQVTVSSVEAAAPDNDYSLVWDYELNGSTEQFVTYIEIGQPMAAYDNLDASMKVIVEDVWVLFADLFDSPDGGPNLQTYWQARFNRGRIAQLLSRAMGKLNTAAQPFQTYTLADPGKFPIAQWGPLLGQALYIEVVKHLIRSYTEQPLESGVGVATLNRRDYIDRWRAVLADEMDTFEDQLEVFKIASMGLGSTAVLVAGGVFGEGYVNRYYPGAVAARYGVWARFH